MGVVESRHDEKADAENLSDGVLLSQLIQLLHRRPKHSLPLADLSAVLPNSLRKRAQEHGGLKQWIRQYQSLFEVTGELNQETVVLSISSSIPDRPTVDSPASEPQQEPDPSAAMEPETISKRRRGRDEALNLFDEENMGHLAIQLRGLPYKSTVEEIRNFLGSHVEKLAAENPVHLVLNRDGRPSGFARVIFESEEAARAARDELHLRGMEDRYVEVFLYPERPSKGRNRRLEEGHEKNAALAEANGMSPEVVVNECRTEMSKPTKRRMLLSMLEQTTHTYHTPLRVMPAEHIVVRCFSCKTHQAVSQNKKGKFACRLCGAHQSVQHIIARGVPGKDLRAIVQELNYTKGKEAEAAEALRFQMEATAEPTPLPLPAPESEERPGHGVAQKTCQSLSCCFSVFPLPVRHRHPTMANPFRATDFVVGGLYVCTFLFHRGAFLNFTDQVGLVLLIAGILVSLGIFIKMQLIGQMRWTFAKKFFDAVMAMPIPGAERKDGIVAQIFTTIITSVIMVSIGMVFGIVGAALDIVVELLSVLAVLVPLGLLLGIQVKRRMTPATLEMICPVIGRFGFFLTLALILRLYRTLAPHRTQLDTSSVKDDDLTPAIEAPAKSTKWAQFVTASEPAICQAKEPQEETAFTTNFGVGWVMGKRPKERQSSASAGNKKAKVEILKEEHVEEIYQATGPEKSLDAPQDRLQHRGVAVTAVTGPQRSRARAYLKQMDQGLKHFLANFPKEFSIEGNKGCEYVAYTPTQEAMGKIWAQQAPREDKPPMSPKSKSPKEIASSGRVPMTPSDWGTPAPGGQPSGWMPPWPANGPPGGAPAAPGEGNAWANWAAVAAQQQGQMQQWQQQQQAQAQPNWNQYGWPGSNQEEGNSNVNFLDPQAIATAVFYGASAAMAAASAQGGYTSGAPASSARDAESAVSAIRLRGLPYASSEQVVCRISEPTAAWPPHSFGDQDVLAFFAQHDVVDRISDVQKAVNILQRSNGRPSGQAIVQMRDNSDAELAQRVLNGQWMGNRYIEVFLHDESAEGQNHNPLVSATAAATAHAKYQVENASNGTSASANLNQAASQAMANYAGLGMWPGAWPQGLWIFEGHKFPSHPWRILSVRYPSEGQNPEWQALFSFLGDGQRNGFPGQPGAPGSNGDSATTSAAVV
eukprot:symbB.v1.2.003128.t1/scaffold128.1/size312424/2